MPISLNFFKRQKQKNIFFPHDHIRNVLKLIYGRFNNYFVMKIIELITLMPSSSCPIISFMMQRDTF